MLFFDTEYYVPKADREQIKSSMIVNPANPDHSLIGGVFYSKRMQAEISPNPKIDGYWIWDRNGDEAALLHAIIARFEQEWESCRKEQEWILKKPIEDLVVCGAGISRFDIPALYCRSVLRGVDTPQALFDLFLKTKQIDLTNVGCFLFHEDKVLYPKTTREMAGRLGIAERKGSSKNVWIAYDEEDYESIKTRTEAELRTVLDIYSRIQERVSSMGSVGRRGDIPR